MQKIRLEYRPFSWLPLKRSFSGSFPGNWEELSPRQLTALASLSEKDPMIGLISVFTGIPFQICRRLDAVQQFDIWQMADWMSQAGSIHRFIIPEISCGRKRLVAPCDGLRKVTFGQFVFFDTCYIRYAESGEAEDLDRFLTSLYLPSGSQFTDQLPLNMEPAVKSVPDKLKQTVLLNYTLVRRWLAERYPLLFSFPLEETGLPDGKNKAIKADPRAWIRVFDNLVGDDIARHEEYGRIPLHNVLRYLTAKTKENLKHS